MKRNIIILSILLMASALSVCAQQIDSSLLGLSIYSSMPQNVMVNESEAVFNGAREQIEQNSYRRFQGYRIRIFFDNGQSARGASEAAARKFSELYPDVPTYRTFSNLYYKVTVGDYRTKSAAMKDLQKYKRQFPSAFIVKEQLRFASD